MVSPRLLEEGALFINYRVHRLVALGSVTQVYEVENARTGRRFALKCLAAMGSTEEQRARFHLGLKMLLDMRHEGLPAVLDGGLDEGKLWLVQELVAGRLIVKGDPKPHWIKTCGWALPATQALHAAAEKGLLHGDLSPDSIVLSDNGAPQIVGLGGHNLYGFSLEHIRATPEFRSPEQRAGRPIDARSDIYSFGLLVYASLAGTGRAPVEVRSFKEVPGCPRALAEIVVKCVQRDPEKRFADWDKLETLLRAVALHQILSPDALQFSAPSSGVRGRDEPEEPADSGAVEPADSGAVGPANLDAVGPANLDAVGPANLDAVKPAASGAAAPFGMERRDTLASVPHTTPPERGGSLTVLEGPPEALRAGSEEISSQEAQEVEAAKEVTGEQAALEEEPPKSDGVPTLRAVGSMAGRFGERAWRDLRAHRRRAAFAGLALGLACSFLLLGVKRDEEPLRATSSDVPKIVLAKAPDAAPAPSTPAPEVELPPREEPFERDQSPIARLRFTAKDGAPLSAAPEEPPVSEGAPAPPPYAGNAERMLETPCGPRCDE
jgi:serine/threonine-protein kinase